jgi:hypothetical protein
LFRAEGNILKKKNKVLAFYSSVFEVCSAHSNTLAILQKAETLILE